MLSETWQRNLIAMFVAQVLTSSAFSFVFPFIPLYVQTLGVRGTAEAAQWAGAISAASALSMAVVQPIWGTLSDRWGRKPMVIRSMAGAAVTTLLMGVATSVDQLLVLRLVQGALSGTMSASIALVSTSTPRYRMGFALGLMQVAVFLGTSIGPLLGGVLSDTVGFRTAFYVAGVLMLLGAALVLGLVRESFVRAPAGTPRPSLLAEGRALWGIRLFPILVVVTFLIQLGVLVVMPVLSLFVAELSGGAGAATAAGAVVAGSGIVSAGSALVVGRLSDRVGHGRVLTICLLGAALSHFPQAFVQQVWQLLVLRMLLGVFLGGLMPSANAMVARVVPRERRGVAFGLTATASALSQAVGPISGAVIATSLGIREVFLATGWLYALAFVWVGLEFRRQGSMRPPGRTTEAPAMSATPPEGKPAAAEPAADTLPRNGASGAPPGNRVAETPPGKAPASN